MLLLLATTSTTESYLIGQSCLMLFVIAALVALRERSWLGWLRSLPVSERSDYQVWQANFDHPIRVHEPHLADSNPSTWDPISTTTGPGAETKSLASRSSNSPLKPLSVAQ